MFKEKLEILSNFLENHKYSWLFIVLIMFSLVFLFTLTETYEMFELNLYDIRFKLKPSVDEWDRLTFVDIDENSLTTIGEFPWTRDKYAAGAEVLKRIGASQMALDIMFPDPSPMHVNNSGLNMLIKKAKRRSPIDLRDIRQVVRDNDQIFADSIADYNRVILSYTFNPDPPTDRVLARQKENFFAEAEKRFIRVASIAIPKNREADFKVLEDKNIKGIAYPIPELMYSAHSFGFVNRYTDIDGAIRKVRLLRVYKNRIYFNLALAMYMDICRVKKKDIEIFPGDKILLKNALNPKNHKIEDISIPIDREGMLYVNWAGPGPREKSFKILPYFALIDYAEFGDAVYEEFDRIDSMEGNNERINLMMELDTARSEYSSAKDNKTRIEKWDQINTIRKKIRKIYDKYLKLKNDEIARIKKELKKDNDPDLQEELEILKGIKDAFEVVIKVESLQDQLVLTGLTATGSHDIGAIPLSKEYARVGTYHNTVNTIYNSEYITKPGSVIQLLIMLIFSILLGLLIHKLSARMSIATLLLSFIVINAFIVLSFSLFDLWIEQLGLNLAMLLPSLTITSIKFLKEESQKRFIKNAFSRYLTPGVIDEIIKNPESLELGGENRVITIFFSDVAGFSTISEKLTPPELVSLLNEYLSEMTDIILKHGGTVDKYEGDAIMAFYGAPHHFDDHALRACLAAIEMKKRLREMQDQWRKQGRDALSVRMGMNSGDAVVGNMGSKSRMDYTAMGDSVNLASRLEGANKYYKTYAMISQSTYEDAKDQIEARKLDIIRVMGKHEPVTVYELLGEKGRLPDRMYEMLEKYYQGLEFFSNRQWKKAKSLFNEALKIIPDDGPSLTYVDRCKEFIKKPPSKKWDGVYSLKAK